MCRSIYVQLVSISFILFGCSQYDGITDKSFETKQYASRVKCKKVEELSNKHTAKELFTSFNKCIEESKYDEGVYIYALAKTYTIYKEMRFNYDPRTDPFSRAGLKPGSLRQVTEEIERSIKKKEIFMEKYKSIISDTKKNSALCEVINKIGAPIYKQYNIVYGENNLVVKKEEIKSTEKDIEDAKAWEASLSKNLKCTKNQ